MKISKQLFFSVLCLMMSNVMQTSEMMRLVQPSAQTIQIAAKDLKATKLSNGNYKYDGQTVSGMELVEIWQEKSAHIGLGKPLKQPKVFDTLMNIKHNDMMAQKTAEALGATIQKDGNFMYHGKSYTPEQLMNFWHEEGGVIVQEAYNSYKANVKNYAVFAEQQKTLKNKLAKANPATKEKIQDELDQVNVALDDLNARINLLDNSLAQEAVINQIQGVQAYSISSVLDFYKVKKLEKNGPSRTFYTIESLLDLLNSETTVNLRPQSSIK